MKDTQLVFVVVLEVPDYWIPQNVTEVANL